MTAICRPPSLSGPPRASRCIAAHASRPAVKGLPPAAAADLVQSIRPRTVNEQAVDRTLTGDTTFSGMSLNPATKTAISRMNISRLTPIQEKAIPQLLARRDLIGQARTGSGKTLAFAVPLAEMCDPLVRQVQAVVLVPTRELAMQVAGVIEALVSPQKMRVTLLYGGRPLKPDYAALRNGAQVVIGTPGRTLDHLRQRTLDLSAVRFLVSGRSGRKCWTGGSPRTWKPL